MGKVFNKEVMSQKQSESDKDQVIASLMQELADTKQQVSDMSQIVAELQLGGTK